MTNDRLHNQDQGNNRPPVELLSAYLDDRESLSSDELEHVQLLLEQDRDTQQVYAELRVISQGLGNLTPVAAPRSYHLDAEMVGAPEPIAMQESRAWYVRHAPAVRWVTAAAAVLFVFVLGADLVLNNVLSDPTDTSDVFTTDEAEMTSRNGSDEAADGDAEPEEAAGDDAAGVQEAPPMATPESTGDDETASQPAESEENADVAEDESEPETAALEVAPGEDEPAPESEEADSDDEGDGATSDESATNQQPFAFDDAQETDDGESDRRLWRIVEFSLVVLLGLLITAMVILPRLGRGSARVRGE